MDLSHTSRSNASRSQVQHNRHAGMAPMPEISTGIPTSALPHYPHVQSQHYNIQTQQAAAYTHTAQCIPRQHAPPISGMSSHSHDQQPVSQGQQKSTSYTAIPRHQNHEQRPMLGLAQASPVDAQQIRRPTDSGMATANTSTYAQKTMQDGLRQSSCLVTASTSSTRPSQPSHDITNTFTYHHVQQLGPSYQAPVQSQSRGVPYTATHPSESRHNSWSHGPQPQANSVPATQEPRRGIPTQSPSVPQGQAIMLSHPYPEVCSSSSQQQHPHSSLSQQLSANPVPAPSSALASASNDPARSITFPVDAVQQIADRHASIILARTYPSLKDFLSNQQKSLRDELLLMNSKYMSNLNKVHHALHSARQAKEEAEKKQESALRESESIIAKAMEWKASLEDTRKKYKSLQDQNTKLAHMALRLNKLVAAESSAGSFAALQERTLVLETRLRKYEDVPFTSIDVSFPTILKEQPDCETESTSPTVRGTPFSPEKGDVEAGSRCSDTAKRRLQNEVNIVAELVERRSKPGSPKSSAEVIKGEPLTEGREKNLLGTPYFIDLTADDSDQNDILDASLSRVSVVTSSIASLFPEPPLDSSFSSEPKSEVLPSNPTSSSGSASSPASSPPSVLGPSIDTLKRSSRTEEDDDRQRKRPRSEDIKLLRDPPRMATTLEEGLDLEKTLQRVPESGDTESASARDSAGVDEAHSAGPATEEDDILDGTMLLSNLERLENYEPTPQLDPVHLQLIYHKDVSGVTECRFCLIEMDNGVRDSDTGTVLPASVSNDELIAHAVSTHCATVSSLLRVDRTELLAAFGNLMEAV